MTLRFGKFKGQEFETTPAWYQTWLLSQDWFTPQQSSNQMPLHKQLDGWDGHSRGGQAVYDAIFEQEKVQSLREDCRRGICTCCEDSPYYGM